ncbi:hypothetical protein Aph02nite_19510 [Actinoplanes philippinensis]|nr:hypothetical protein Aph02nite_19510 [Actinoplanes philippinensis]
MTGAEGFGRGGSTAFDGMSGGFVAAEAPGKTAAAPERTAAAGKTAAAPERTAAAERTAAGKAGSAVGRAAGRGLSVVAGGVTDGAAAGAGVSAGGGTSLMLALLSAASRSGAWCAVVGMPALGAVAAAESGVVLERLALVPDPGPDWATVVAALIDGVDVVVAAVSGPVSPTIVSRLAARARQRGSLLVPFGEWAGADVHLRVGEGRWEGLGFGRGRLRRREVTVVAQGRGAAARPQQITMWMPGVSVRSGVVPPAPSRSADGGSTLVGPVSAMVAPPGGGLSICPPDPR